MKPSREELAWAAGFFDGEGNTRSRRVADRGGQPPILSVSQVDEFSLLRFKNAVLGLGTIRGPYGPYSANRKPYYVWSTNRLSHSIAVCGLLWHWLGPVKRGQLVNSFRLHWGNREA